MREIKIVADTSCELTIDEATALGIDLVPFNITIDNKTYFKETFDITITDFYKQVKTKGVYPKTSLPSPSDYLEVFERNVKDGKDIVCLCLSSGLSGAYQSAVSLANSVMDEYPEAKIHVVDTKLATGVLWSVAIDAVELVKQGASAENIVNAVERSSKECTGTLTVDSLDFLAHGGRINKAAYVAGSVLDIKPIVHLKDGVLVQGVKLRGRKKAISYLVDTIEEALKGKDLNDYRLLALYGDTPENGHEVRSVLSERLNVPESDIVLGVVGTTIGSHTGPTISVAGCLPRLRI